VLKRRVGGGRREEIFIAKSEIMNTQGEKPLAD
jgi:hypothetical protein